MNKTQFWNAVMATETYKIEQNLASGVNENALDRHMAHTERARAATETIITFIEDHGEVAPEDVDWGHVGTMAHIANALQDIVAEIRS